MFVFKLPEIGEGVIEGEVVRWLVSQGETIAPDQPVCEVMTDKATVEISSPTGGLVQRLHAEEGDIITQARLEDASREEYNSIGKVTQEEIPGAPPPPSQQTRKFIKTG